MTFTFRTLADRSADAVESFAVATPDPDRWRADLAGCFAEGTLRPEWCWQALDETGAVRASLYWWGRSGAPEPSTLISVLRSDHDAAVALVEHSRAALRLQSARTALTIANLDEARVEDVHPEYAALLAATGFEPTVERIRLEWRAEFGIGGQPGALSFRPTNERRPGEVVALLAEVIDGSLDHGMQVGAAREGRQLHAEQMLADFLLYSGPPEWFVLGERDGVPVGYVIASVIDAGGVLAELGVARAHRGNHYAGELLAHGTGLLMAAGHRHIRADTDRANSPMRAAFAAGGYREIGHRVDYRWER